MEDFIKNKLSLLGMTNSKMVEEIMLNFKTMNPDRSDKTEFSTQCLVIFTALFDEIADLKHRIGYLELGGKIA